MTIDSPIGPLQLEASNQGLAAIRFAGTHHPPIGNAADPLLQQAARELAEYFAGTRRRFGLALAPRGTPFQQQVWRALEDIPYGAVCSYRDIARSVGREKAVRAVGAANGRNPLPIVVPCHRVIGSNGQLTGYAGGLAIKQQLLALEGFSQHSLQWS
nr:methylated-DNA--[protein]-cysteine S-methyltransferase [Parahaliea mediterranea]